MHSTHALALSVVLALASCAEAPAPAPPTRVTALDLGPERTSLVLEEPGVARVTVEVAPDVRCRLDQVIAGAGPAEGPTGAVTLDGHPLAPRGGRLLVGETDLGPVPEGGLVRLSRAEGAVVDGERRGSLPAALPGSP